MSAWQNLVQSLDQLVTVYRHLLDVVRRELEALEKAEMRDIPDINDAKEKLVVKVRQLDSQWQEAANQLGQELGVQKRHPSLLELAKMYKGEEAQKLESLHSVLTMLVKRISEINKKNEILVQAALSHISGAMNSITRTLNENPTYKNSGGMDQKNKDAQGRLISREA